MNSEVLAVACVILLIAKAFYSTTYDTQAYGVMEKSGEYGMMGMVYASISTDRRIVTRQAALGVGPGWT